LIRSKAYAIRQRLPTEAEFCKQFSASRTAVREALKGLQSRGLVHIRKGSGVYVSEPNSIEATNPLDLYFEMSDSSDLVVNTLQARQLFEPEIAALAALKRTKADVVKLEENLARFEACDVHNIEKDANLDIEFHRLIASAGGNSVISIIMNPIHNLATRQRMLVFGKSEKLDSLNEVRNIVFNFHHRIWKAIKDRDSKEAFYQMKEHLLYTVENLKKIKPPGEHFE